MLAFKKFLMFGGLVAGLLIHFSVTAQSRVPIVEAGSSQTQNQTQNQPANENSGQNEILVNMYLQLEALQAEIQNLRGTVEEQSFQIRRMQTEQRDRYLDTDSRLGELYNQVQAYHSGQGIPAQLPAGQVPNTGTGSNNQVNNPPRAPLGNQGNPIVSPGPSTVAAGAGVGVSSPQNEQALYRQALNLLLEDEAFQESITLFQQYMDVYSQGRYFTNALYWQGAALELLGNHNQAIVVLQRLISEFPEDPKAPTALLRLGTVYRKMGDNTRAAASWQDIGQRYPGATSEIEIANEYLSEIGN